MKATRRGPTTIRRTFDIGTGAIPSRGAQPGLNIWGASHSHWVLKACCLCGSWVDQLLDEVLRGDVHYGHKSSPGRSCLVVGSRCKAVALQHEAQVFHARFRGGG